MTAATSASTAQTATSAALSRVSSILTPTCTAMNVIANGGNMMGAAAITGTIGSDAATQGVAGDLVKDILDIAPIAFCT